MTVGPQVEPHPVALVTGAGAPRVGNHVARALSRRGYRVALQANRSIDGARATADELCDKHCEAIALSADLRDEEAIARMVADVKNHFGRIDALVNCAAVWRKEKLEDVSADGAQSDFEINALGTFLCAREAGMAMVSQPSGGAIVNIGDWAVIRPYADYASYFLSKGAIPTLTRALAVELGGRNPRVRVNAILPGPVMLPEGMTAAEREAVVAQTLVKREGSPEHVAHAVIFLLENDFVTGVCLPVDGGRSVFAP